MTPETDRRSFLTWAIFGLGAIFSVILGVPVVCYFIDPRNRKAPKSSAKLVDGVKLDELAENAPRQGVIRDTRTDGWTLYPSDVIGRVWVVRAGARPVFADKDIVTAYNAKPIADKEKYLIVFTTICPHLGCSVNLNNFGNGFECPCHAATFNLSGSRIAESNPAKRGMDTLEWEIDVDDPTFNRIKVKFQKFATSTEAKTSLS